MIYDGGLEFTSIQLTDRGITSALNEALPQPAVIFREYMDLTRIHATGYERALRDFYRNKYAGDPPQVIVAIRGRPLDFLLENKLFPGVPIVSAGMDARQIEVRRLPPTVTGSTLKVRYWPSIALALTLVPNTEQVAIVLGASPNDKALEALVRDELRGHESALKFDYIAGLSMDAVLKKVSGLPPRSAVLFVSLAQDAHGHSYLPDRALALVAAAANAPTYVASDDVLDSGAVGGDVVSFAGLGSSTAGVALRILRGEKPADIPFVDYAARVKVLDARQLERWHIPLARAPGDSIVMNRVPTLWEAYGGWIEGGVGLFVLQSGLIALLVFQRRRRRIAEQRLQSSEDGRRSAVVEERNRMSRDMHDTLAQGFTGVIVQLEAAKQAIAHGSSSDADAHVERASELARHSLGEARRSIRALRPAVLENGHLRDALEGVMTQMTAGTLIKTEFKVQGQPRPLTPSREETLLRIYQEIVTNALKHSNATAIRAALAFEKRAVRLQVQDDGSGFKPPEEHDGLGLVGIRERLDQVNGALEIESLPGEGTRICVLVPYAGDRETKID